MKKFTTILAVFAVLFLACGNVFAGGHGGHRPAPPAPAHHAPQVGHRPAPAPAPRYNHHDHHHDHGPSRGWWNGALVVGATLGLLDIATRPTTTTVVHETVATPAVVPQTVYVQQPVPQTVYVQQPVPQTVYVQQPGVATQTIYTQDGTQVIYTQPAQTVVTPASVIYR